MWSTLLLLFCLAALSGTVAPICSEGSETDCSLNGVCNNEGVCVCDPGWKGDKCNQLKLKPPSRLEPHGYFNGSMPTWGGDVIYENGIYHAFLTAKGYNTPPYDESDRYVCNTAIIRLEGKSPAGPFEFAEVVLPVYHHETHAIRAPDEPVFGWHAPKDWPPSLVYPVGQIISNEGAFIWRSKRGYHMLTHCQLSPNHSTRGAYGYSKDGLSSWTLLPDLMWDANMTWADGSVSYFKRRQGPGLYFDDNGHPLYLLTPVDELYQDGCNWGHGWTLMQPIEH
uniref:EGF-like domain-containing protein n=1 Tax=Amphimedon queenslandica TaxID=400682 RepID=A0A1X7VLM4_AMPQE